MDIIGVDLGGTKTAVLKADDMGGIVSRVCFATPGPEEGVVRICEEIEKFGTGDDAICGIACGDPIDPENGVVLNPPNMPGWDGVAIVDIIEKRFGIKAYMMNDANAGAVAEWLFGAAKGFRNVIFLTYGTGMGAGLILDGRLYEGTTYSAGEVGHIRLANEGPVGYGKAGSFEGFCSGGGIGRLARLRFKGQRTMLCADDIIGGTVSAKDIAEAARQGDGFAMDVFAESAGYAGLGISVLVDILNPEIIVLGSLFSRCRDLIEPGLLARLGKESLERPAGACRIVPTGLGERIGDYAAISAGLYRAGLVG